MRTDAEWEQWASTAPYFGVYSDDAFVGQALSAEAAATFFASGEQHVAELRGHLDRIVGAERRFAHGVDFGSGVGRLTVPLLALCERMTGLDVAPSIVALAGTHVPPEHQSRIEYALSDDSLSNLPGEYDLVHSYIVMQHIAPGDGLALTRRLLRGLVPGGVAALHFTIAPPPGLLRSLVRQASWRLPPLHAALSMARGGSPKTPVMRMHAYDLAKIVALFRDCGIPEPLLVSTNHSGWLGAMLIGARTPSNGRAIA